MKVSKKMKNISFVTLGIISFSFLIFSLLSLYQKADLLFDLRRYNRDDETTLTREEQDRIEEFSTISSYKLRRNPTIYQIELFEQLIDSQLNFFENSTEANMLSYAEKVVQNFIADFFTLSNKNSRSDVGGLQFIADELVNDFQNFAIDEFYLHLNSQIEMYGRQSLPTVQKTFILNTEFVTRTEMRKDYSEYEEERLVKDAFGNILGVAVETIVVDIEWEYGLSTLDYINEFQTRARVTLLQQGNSLVIFAVEELPIESNIIL